MMGTSTDRINKTKCLINRPCLLPQLHQMARCQIELWILRWSWLHVFQCQVQPDSNVKALCQLPYFSDNLDENLAGQQTCDVTNINLLNILTNTRSAKMSQGIHCFSTLVFIFVNWWHLCPFAIRKAPFKIDVVQEKLEKWKWKKLFERDYCDNEHSI